MTKSVDLSHIKSAAHDKLNAKQYFPTQVFSMTLDAADGDALNGEMIKLIRAERDRDTVGISRSNLRSLGGWHSQNFLHKDDDYAPLVSLIDACGEQIRYTSNHCFQPVVR